MTRRETVFMFSGQGSQYFHMGAPLYERDATFRDWMARLDDIARRVTGRSVIEALYSRARGKGDPFDRTLMTHPAIFMVEYSLAQSLMRAGVRPDLVLGVSLGSFAAAAVAGFVEAEDALTAVIHQAAALEQWCDPGCMVAVMADPALYEDEFLSRRSELAAVNFSTHFVVSAKRTELAAIETRLRQQNVPYQRLPVSFAFHSRWMDEAREPFAAFARSMVRREGTLPLVCSDRAAILSEVSDEYFWDVVRRPIRFRDAAALLEGQRPRRYVDVGPAGTLATFLKYSLPATSESTVHAVLTPFGVDEKNFAAVAASAGH